MFYFCTMLIFKNIFNFYLKASIHVALAIVCLVKLTHELFNIPSTPEWFFFLFFGIMTGYNFLKYAEYWYKFGLNPSFPQKVFGFSMFSLLITVFFFLKLSSHLQLIFLGIFAWMICYHLVRNYAIGKLTFVAITITFVTILLPCFYANRWFDQIGLVFLSQFLLIFALLVPFEIADSTTDSMRFPTLPQRIGIVPFKIIGILSVLGYFLVFIYLNLNLFLGLFFFLSSLFAILLSHSKRSFYFTAFWVEAIPVFGWLFYFCLGLM